MKDAPRASVVVGGVSDLAYFLKRQHAVKEDYGSTPIGPHPSSPYDKA